VLKIRKINQSFQLFPLKSLKVYIFQLIYEWFSAQEFHFHSRSSARISTIHCFPFPFSLSDDQSSSIWPFSLQAKKPNKLQTNLNDKDNIILTPIFPSLLIYQCIFEWSAAMSSKNKYRHDLIVSSSQLVIISFWLFSSFTNSSGDGLGKSKYLNRWVENSLKVHKNAILKLLYYLKYLLQSYLLES
jgi:hypothetical protein